MRDSSTQFGQAASKEVVLWAPPLVEADWDNDGYGTADSTGPTLMNDTFNRTSVNSWGSNDGGQGYGSFGVGGSVLASDYQVTPGTATHSMPVSNGYRVSTLANVPDDMDVIVEFSLPAVPTGGPVEPANILSRFQTTSIYYMHRIAVNTTRTIDCVIYYTGGLGELGRVTSKATYASGENMKVRCQTISNMLRVKVWRANTSEPLYWDLTVYDSNLTSGDWGIRSGVASSNTNTKPYVFSYHSIAYQTNTIDDLSEKAGSGIRIRRGLDDGMPIDVSMVTGGGSGSPIAAIPLEWGDGSTEQQGKMAARYFSRYNTSSPVYGKMRDVAPVHVDLGVITGDGAERVPVFTGRMIDLSTTTRDAALEATSATRLKLTKLVQPPVFWGRDWGLNATWLIDRALYECGLYTAPPPRPGCRLYVPCTGSLFPFLPGGTALSLTTFSVYQRENESVTPTDNSRPSFVIGGPFGPAVELSVSGSFARYCNMGMDNHMATGGGPFSTQSSNKGRVEFWVRGDSFDTSILYPSGPPNTYGPVRFQAFNNTAGTGGIVVGVSWTRRLFVTLDDGDGSPVTVNGATLPEDGQWHSLGFAWDFSGNRAWTYINGTQTTHSSVGVVTTNLPTSEDFTVTDPIIVSYLPLAQIHLTSGNDADPTAVPWLTDTDFTPSAVIEDMSLLEFETYPFPLPSSNSGAPAEAYRILAELASADLAAMRIDEDDIYHYYGRAWYDDRVGSTSFGQLQSTDVFARSESNGWGGIWTTSGGSASDYSVNGSNAVMALTSTNVARVALVGGNVQNIDLYGEYTCPVTPTGAGITQGALARYVDANNFVDGRLFLATSGVVTCAVRQVVGGVETAGTTTTVNGPTATSTIKWRFQADGTTLRFKAWNSINEPVAWTTTMTTNHTTAGDYGVRTIRDTGNTNGTVNMAFDNWSAHLPGPNTGTLDTDTNMADPEVVVDPTKIRNDVQVDFKRTSLSTRDTVAQYSELVTLPVGITTIRVVWTAPISDVPIGTTFNFTNLTEANVDGGLWNVYTSHITINNQPDGSGTYATDADVSARITAWDAAGATIKFTNSTTNLRYLVNDGAAVPYLHIAGWPAIISDDFSQAQNLSDIQTRGERALRVQLPAIQRQTDAQKVAGALLNRLRRERGHLTVRAFGDPRRQPTDLVAVSDTASTQMSGLWRLLEITDEQAGPSFTQLIRAYEVLEAEPLTVDVQEFSVSGTWTKPSGAQMVLVRLQGAGGGGGGATGAGSGIGVGGGGGSGGYVEHWFDADNLAESISVGIGTGGAGAANGTGTGTSGGGSTFGTLSAGGGNGGSGTTAGTGTLSAEGGTGGTASGGTVNRPGQKGGLGRTISGASVFTSHGGTSPFSAGGAASTTTGAAAPDAAGFGGGGGGAVCSTTSRAGGDGSGGFCVVVSFA